MPDEFQMILRRLTEHLRKQEWTAVAIDFVIVVLGVVIGLQVNNWNEERLDQRRTTMVLGAIRESLGDYDSVTTHIHRDVSEGLAAFDEARARGERPAPFILRFRGSDLPPQTVWESALQSNLAELVHPSLLFDLGFFYSEQQGIGVKFVRYSEFVEREILPWRATPAVFYDEGGNLKPQYAQNIERLREWVRDTEVLVRSSRCLQERFHNPTQPGPTCRPDYSDHP